MNRSVLDPADRFRVQHKLDRNETLVWVGRPVPTFRYRGWIGTVIFAVPWCAITGTFVVGVLIPAWMGKPVDGEAWGIWPKLGLTAFLTPFILIGIGTLFSPLWHKLSQQGQLYAVTDKRSFVIGRFFTKSWRGSEMFEPDRADHRAAGTGIGQLEHAGRFAGLQRLRPCDQQQLEAVPEVTGQIVRQTVRKSTREDDDAVLALGERSPELAAGGAKPVRGFTDTTSA